MRNIICALGILLLTCNLISTAYASDVDNWPRRFENSDSTFTTINAKPTRVLSTSVTVTGTLLAINAPVIASATTTYGHFFEQWKEVAQQREVMPLWPAGSVDIEQAMAIQPDLIIVSLSGADSALDQINQLQQIAPTIVVDYGSMSWQELATKLGYALGIEEQVKKKIDQFNQDIAQVRSSTKLPQGMANIISYHGPGMANPIATPDSAHGKLLTSLGFTIESPNPEWNDTATNRNNFVWSHYENLSQLKSRTTFLLSADDSLAQDFIADPILQNVPSVKSRRVYGLGKNSFRIDYYSALEIIAGVKAHFSSSDN
ncbi:Fe2+-enterobactin ABC transporter substrate-binding protein [Vibrio viridaestus]|uniref:Fe2+-enterobactin ABC transporter substrate-binding protein n=1 Tax=Vibrio viridaestus TaxID=2487322 RepID=UPI001AA03C43|nr:Fe2+-enterobactin ABC transporter substrate-binding protein [Vibrio viridaestus]